MTKIIELIYTEDRRGTGEDNDVIRLVPQLFTKAGLLVAENDIYKQPVFNSENLTSE